MKHAGLVLCGALAACSREEPSGSARTTAELTSAEMQSSDPRPSPARTFVETDPLLTHRVEAAIASDPRLSMAARNVDLTVEDRNVTLRGSVPDLGTRDALIAAISKVPEIRDTRSDLFVDPSRDRGYVESDEKIAFRLQRLFAAHPAIASEAEKVTIDVQQGKVVLRGRIASADTRTAIVELADDTPGVVGVVNELRPR
jgi:osmotically-inducible protein OsmY